MHYVTISRLYQNISAFAIIAYSAGLLAIWRLSIGGEIFRNIAAEKLNTFSETLKPKHEIVILNSIKGAMSKLDVGLQLQSDDQPDRMKENPSHWNMAQLRFPAENKVFAEKKSTELDDMKVTNPQQENNTIDSNVRAMGVSEESNEVKLKGSLSNSNNAKKPSGEDVVPRTVHITWFYPANTSFHFHHAICLLSVQRYFRPSRIFFWHSSLPSGRWWDFTRHSVAHLLLVPYVPPTSVNNRSVAVPEHQSDVARLELIEEYGGLYVDLDVILVRSLNPLLRFDITLGAETPHLLGSGLILARPNASFIRLWRATYDEEFDDRRWNHQSVVVPMRLARRHPGLVHVEWYSIHRPNWSEREWLYTPGKLWNWMADNYAVHLWYREHHVDYDPISIRKLNTTLGEVLRHIYYNHPLPMAEDV